MKIVVKVIPNSSLEKIEKISENLSSTFPKRCCGEYKIWLHAKPIEGEANKKVIQLLAEYFDVSKSQVTLVSGQKSRTKVFEIK